MIPKEWRVLIVEDEQDTRHKLEQLVRSTYGCRVSVAEDEHAGLEAAWRECPELVLLNLKLPEAHTDSTEVVRQIRASLSRQHTLIFAISNFCWDEAYVRRATAAGCEACLDKNRLIVDFKPTLSTAVRNALFARDT